MSYIFKIATIFALLVFAHSKSEPLMDGLKLAEPNYNLDNNLPTLQSFKAEFIPGQNAATDYDSKKEKPESDPDHYDKHADIKKPGYSGNRQGDQNVEHHRKSGQHKKVKHHKKGKHHKKLKQHKKGKNHKKVKNHKKGKHHKKVKSHKKGKNPKKSGHGNHHKKPLNCKKSKTEFAEKKVMPVFKGLK